MVPFRLAHIFLVLLVFQNTTYTLYRYYATAVLKEQWRPGDVLLAAELLKFTIASAATMFDDSPSDAGSGATKINYLLRNSMELFPPALVYLIMNLLSYVALARISGALFTVFTQLKILSTGLCGAIMLGRTYSWAQWRAMLLVGLGAILVSHVHSMHRQKQQLQRQEEGSGSVLGDAPNNIEGNGTSLQFLIGCGAVILEVSLSGLVTVYFEKVLKSKKTNLSVWDRNVQLSFYSGIMYWMYHFLNGEEGAFFAHWTLSATLLTILCAGGGIVTAFAVKHTDSVIKALTQSMGIVSSLLVEYGCLSGPLNVVNAVGSAIVIMAVVNYVDAQQPQDAEAKRDDPPSRSRSASIDPEMGAVSSSRIQEPGSLMRRHEP